MPCGAAAEAPGAEVVSGLNRTSARGFTTCPGIVTRIPVGSTPVNLMRIFPPG